MTSYRIPSRGAVGGSANEAGAEYRRGVAAYFIAHGLNGIPVEGLPVAGDDAVVEAVALETDFPIDDILVSLKRGRLFIQAKRSLDWAVMPEVADQWIAALRDPEFDSATDFLSVAAASLSGPVRVASRVLSRMREGATSLAVKETDAIARLQTILSLRGATDGEIKEIKRSAVIFHLMVEEPGETEATRGRLLLDGHVVAKGEGARAWRELLALAGATARGRLAHSIETWLQLLRERGVSLVSDIHSSRAGYLTARHDAVSRYRALLMRHGEVVDLNPLGIAVPPIKFDAMDAGIDFYSGNNNREALDPFWTFRRRGRVVLTGLPGGGKSTTVASIAGEWASHTSWSLPILASLRRLAEKQPSPQRSLRDRLVDTAVTTLDPSDRPLVTEALHHALREGNAVLFFDGLDEASDRGLLLIADIAKLLEGVHPDTDVLITTRDIAYSATQQLGFVDLRLGPPRDVSLPVAAVLESIAAVRGIDHVEIWIAARKKWVEHALRADAALRETPLFPVLLASLAADLPADTLPQTRTLILEQVVHDVVKRRETTRELVLPGIHESHFVPLLLGSFPLIAVTLLDSGGTAGRERLIGCLVPYLQNTWGLAAGVALATAEQVVFFWDEAGVFVASGGEKTVAPRSQLMLEIGVALHAAALPDALAVSWVREALTHPELKEVMVLAAGKSRVIADSFVIAACEQNDYSLIKDAARVIAQGGMASEASHRRLLGKLNQYIALGRHEGWRAFRAVSELAVPDDLLASILETVDLHYPDPYPAIARAYAASNWGWQSQHLARYLETVLLHKRPRLPKREEGKGFDITALSIDLEMRVLELAVTTLLPARPDLAGAAAAAMSDASLRTADVIGDALRKNGHEELAHNATATWAGLDRQLIEGAQDTRRQIDKFLATLRSTAPTANLSLPQRRRLPELASFIQTLDLNKIDSWPRTQDSADTWPSFIAAVITLGGFDKSVLAAQAAILESEVKSDLSRTPRAFWSLIDVYPPAPLQSWDHLAQPSDTRELMLQVLRSGGSGARGVAAQALIDHPDKRGTATCVRTIIDNGPPSGSYWAVWAYLNLVDDVESAITGLSLSPRASVREGIARLIPAVHDGAVLPFASMLIKDSVRRVSLAVLENLKRSPHDLRIARALLADLAEGIDSDFKCPHCGTMNLASSDSCTSCHTITERPSKVAERLLATVQDSK